MDITHYLLGIILSFTRVASFLFFIPFLKNKAIPAAAKIAISLGISIVAVDQIDKIEINNLVELAGMIAVQFLIGITLAFVIDMIVSAVIIAGGIVDMDLGFSAVTILDPSTNQNVTVISNIFNIIFTIVFIQVGGLHMLISGIVFSFNFLTPGFFIGNESFLEAILGVFGYMFIAAIQIALPFIATMFILNIVLLILGKSAPQMNIFLTMYMIKISVGILVLYISLPFLSEVFTQINDDMISYFSDVMNEIFKK